MAAFELFLDGLDFGEGPRWHDGRLWYSDFYQHRVYAVGEDGERETILELPDGAQPSGLGWMPDGSLLLVSMLDRTVLRFADGELSEHADLSDIATFHCNDMVVDTAGNAYVGNFGWDIVTDFRNVTPAKLALVRPDGSTEAVADDLLFPNGAVITPDGATLIVGESFGARPDTLGLLRVLLGLASRLREELGLLGTTGSHRGIANTRSTQRLRKASTRQSQPVRHITNHLQLQRIAILITQHQSGGVALHQHALRAQRIAVSDGVCKLIKTTNVVEAFPVDDDIQR